MTTTLNKQTPIDLSPSIISKKWFDLYFDEFYKIAFSIVNNKEKSTEIIKDTFFSGLKNLESYDIFNERDWLLMYLTQNIEKNNTHSNNIETSQLIIEQVLNKMPKLQKDAFILKTFKGYSTQNICEKLNINEKEFWTYIRISRKQLIANTVN